MAKIRIVDLAQELKVDPHELLNTLKERGFSVRRLSSLLSEEEVERVKALFRPKSEVIVIKKDQIALKVEEKPKKLKLIIKKKIGEGPLEEEIKSEEEKVQSSKKVGLPETEIFLEEKVLKEEKLTIKTEEEIRKPFEIFEEQDEREYLDSTSEAPSEMRVITDFTSKREKPFKSKPEPGKAHLGEAAPSSFKEELRKRKKEDFKEERKKAKKKPFPKKAKLEREEKEEIFEEETFTFF